MEGGIMKHRIIFLVCILALSLGKTAMGFTAKGAPAAMVPQGLAPGDTFYIMFVTSTPIAGNRSVVDYNAHVNSTAANASVRGTDQVLSWRAWLGHDDGTLQTESNFAGDSSRPIYNLGGQLVAPDYTSLVSGAALSDSINYDETGAQTSSFVWTGTFSDGLAAIVGDDTLGGDDSANDGCAFGISNAATREWAKADILSGDVGCTDQYPVYAVSPLLAVVDSKPEIGIESGYFKLDNNGRLPPDTDCIVQEHVGRMYFHYGNNLLYICTQSGWGTTPVAVGP